MNNPSCPPEGRQEGPPGIRMKKTTGSTTLETMRGVTLHCCIGNSFGHSKFRLLLLWGVWAGKARIIVQRGRLAKPWPNLVGACKVVLSGSRLENSGMFS